MRDKLMNNSTPYSSQLPLWQRAGIAVSALFFSVLWADEWYLDTADTTYKILTFFFGTVSEELICVDSSCSYLMPQLMSVFNQGFITFSSLVLTFVMLTSTASSAHEGEFLGKRASSIATPLRLMLGTGMLLPTQTGYSYLQIFMMKLILFGVMLGNNVYAVLRNYVEDNKVTFAMEKVSTDSSADTLNSLAKLSSSIYTCEFCYAYVQNLIQTGQLSPQQASDWGMSSDDTMNEGPLYFECEPNFYGYAYTTDSVTQVATNCPNSYTNPQPNVCGVWSYYFTGNDPDPTITQSVLTELQLSLRYTAYNDLDYLVNHGYTMDYTTGRNSAEIIAQSLALATERLNYNIVNPEDSPNPDNDKNDWLEFPYNFYKWLQYGNELDLKDYVNVLTYQMGSVDSSSSGTYTDEFASIKTSLKNQKYFDTNTLRNKLYQGDDVGEYDFVGRDGGPVSYAFTEIGRMMKDGKEPLVTLTMYGLAQLTLAFDMLMTGMIMGGILVLIASILSSFLSSYGSGVAMALVGFIQNFFMAFGFLIPLGVGLGVYLPMVPMMTYCGAVIGWLMTVIEAMVAGPVIVLGIMSPGGGNHLLGRAQPGFLILIRVMLGPALIVLGMVVGAKLFDIFAAYFTQIFIYGFAHVTSAGTYGAWVGLIFIPYFFFYSLFMVGLGTRCYSMTYLLIDKTTTWIGGQAGASVREMQQVLDEGKRGADQGGQELQNQTQKVADSFSEVGDGVSRAIKDRNEG